MYKWFSAVHTYDCLDKYSAKSMKLTKILLYHRFNSGIIYVTTWAVVRYWDACTSPKAMWGGSEVDCPLSRGFGMSHTRKLKICM